MSVLNVIVWVIASVTLFLYGLQSFTKEIRALVDGPLKSILEKTTKNRFAAAAGGALATAILQSSSAVAAMAVSLTDVGLLNIRAVLAIMIGANIGTASTAFLVSYKVQGLGAYFLVCGAVLSLFPIRYRVIGKSLFYFGFILFALDQIGIAMEPLQQEPFILDLLLYTGNVFIGLLVGTLLTAILQSSSVVTGLAIMLATQQSIPLVGAVAVVLGANIGTTSTALVASLSLGSKAKIVALANFAFNLMGVLLILPFITLLTQFCSSLSDGSEALAVAYSHLFFNCFMGLMFLCFLTPAEKFLSIKLDSAKASLS